jgi:hypothetical protein
MDGGEDLGASNVKIPNGPTRGSAIALHVLHYQARLTRPGARTIGSALKGAYRHFGVRGFEMRNDEGLLPLELSNVDMAM